MVLRVSAPLPRRYSPLDRLNYTQMHDKTRNTLYCDQSNYSLRIVFSQIPIEFVQTEISAIRSAELENPTIEPNMKWIRRSLAEIIWPFEIFPNVRSSVAGRSVLNIYFFLH